MQKPALTKLASGLAATADDSSRRSSALSRSGWAVPVDEVGRNPAPARTISRLRNGSVPSPKWSKSTGCASVLIRSPLAAVPKDSSTPVSPRGRSQGLGRSGLPGGAGCSRPARGSSRSGRRKRGYAWLKHSRNVNERPQGRTTDLGLMFARESTPRATREC